MLTVPEMPNQVTVVEFQQKSKLLTSVTTTQCEFYYPTEPTMKFCPNNPVGLLISQLHESNSAIYRCLAKLAIPLSCIHTCSIHSP